MSDFGIYNFEEIRKNLERIRQEEKEVPKEESNGVDLTNQSSVTTEVTPIYFRAASSADITVSGNIIYDKSWGSLKNVG